MEPALDIHAADSDDEDDSQELNHYTNDCVQREDDEPPQIPVRNEAPPIPTECPEPRCYIAMCAYEARFDDEIDFDTGELILVTKVPKGGWWYGHCNKASGRMEGWFPSNHVNMPSWGKVVNVQTNVVDEKRPYINVEISEKTGVVDLAGLQARLNKVKEISATIEHWSGTPLHEMASTLIHDGALLQIPMSSDGSDTWTQKRYGRHFFLFDTLLIWCKRTTKGAYVMKGKVALNEINIMVPRNQTHKFTLRHSWLVFLHNTNKVFRCCPPTEALKKSWLDHFGTAGVHVSGLQQIIQPSQELNVAQMQMTDAERIEVMEMVKLGHLTIDEALEQVKIKEGSKTSHQEPLPSSSASSFATTTPTPITTSSSASVSTTTIPPPTTSATTTTPNVNAVAKVEPSTSPPVATAPPIIKMRDIDLYDQKGSPTDTPPTSNRHSTISNKPRVTRFAASVSGNKLEVIKGGNTAQCVYTSEIGKPCGRSSMGGSRQCEYHTCSRLGCAKPKSSRVQTCEDCTNEH
eukprot:m.31861 g.31861  ORF g.31861 m.31861 type:complete len:519 (-) comp16543_c0_seq1:40-1596(-)